jgi:hypothetical protein
MIAGICAATVPDRLGTLEEISAGVAFLVVPQKRPTSPARHSASPAEWVSIVRAARQIRRPPGWVTGPVDRDAGFSDAIRGSGSARR